MSTMEYSILAIILSLFSIIVLASLWKW